MNNAWNFYTTNEIKPSGWLKQQLQIQAAGLSGNLDKIWPDIRDSKWIGGNAEGWERVPYWLDGFIPLAYLLEDEDMIRRAQDYIHAIIRFQKPDGWICPCRDEERSSYDTWVVLLITKVLKVYYDCSGEEQIPQVIYRVLKNYYNLLKGGTLHLFDWGKFRWYEGFIAINFLQERYQEEWIRDLGRILYEQGQNYDEWIDAWKRPINRWTFGTHIVNLAMMLKSEAVSCDLLGRKYTDQAEKYYRLLKKYNGTPVELFTGDECLSGLSPIQGTELCAVVEQMYAYELLYAYTGDTKWAERLEIIAFNALPATFSDDMWAHQYVQQSNQIACKTFPGRSLFRTNGPESHLFGLEPNYGCCTANLSQGWPKLTLSAFLHRDNTIINMLTIPAVLDTFLTTASGKTGLRISLDTCYPFENTFTYRINAMQPVSFTFKVRIPSFAKAFKVNGQSLTPDTGSLSPDTVCTDTSSAVFTVSQDGSELTLQLTDCKDLTFTMAYDTLPEMLDRPYRLKTAKCGSLIYSVPVSYTRKQLEYVRDGVERKYPYCDYEYEGTSEWAYGFADTTLEKVTGNMETLAAAFQEDLTASGTASADSRTDSYVFSSQNPPVMLKARVKKVNWGLEDGFEYVCAKKPLSYRGIGDTREILLYPYGCAKLRMTELPLV